MGSRERELPAGWQGRAPRWLTWKDGQAFDKNGPGVIWEDGFPGLENDINKEPVMGKSGKCMGLVSRVHWKKQQTVKRERGVGT